MNRMAVKFVGLALLGFLIGVGASCQVSRVEMSPPGQVIRVIDDPHTGHRWLLVRDPDHAGGPGRLVLVAGGSDGLEKYTPTGAVPRIVPPPRPKPKPVIHGGDRLIVEENTPQVDARFEAVALGSAPAGSPLRVRLVLGGKVLSAMALGPGRAALRPETEVLP